MGKFQDISGQTFGNITVIKRDGSYTICNGKHTPKWLCRCNFCGKLFHVNTYRIKALRLKSCGCQTTNLIREKSKFHGLGGTRLSYIWRDMRKRCYNPKSESYKNYGGRGVRICDEWLDDAGFLNFYKWAMENGYNDNLTIDRINNNDHYKPDNCRWVTKSENTNNRRNHVFVEFNGEILNLTQLARKLNVNPRTISKQKTRGWSLEKILRKAGVTDENILLHSCFTIKPRIWTPDTNIQR